MNQVILIGRLCQEPRLQYTQEGVAVGEFTLAVRRPKSRGVGNGAGNRASTEETGEDARGVEGKTDFIDVVVWRKLAESCGEHLGQGRKVAIQGHLEVQKYAKGEEIKKVAKVIAYQVQFLEKMVENRSAQQ